MNEKERKTEMLRVIQLIINKTILYICIILQCIELMYDDRWCEEELHPG